MADEFDPCECIWNHEMSMRRLISWLRQSQAHCTDTECIDDVANLPVGGELQDNGLLMMGMLVALMIAMFFMRPQSLRGNANGSSKPHNDTGSNGPPPSSTF